MQQQATRIAKALPPAAIPLSSTVAIPGNATPELEEFLVERARLYHERAAIQNRLAQSPAEAAAALGEWQQKNHGRIEKGRGTD